GEGARRGALRPPRGARAGIPPGPSRGEDRRDQPAGRGQAASRGPSGSHRVAVGQRAGGADPPERRSAERPVAPPASARRRREQQAVVSILVVLHGEPAPRSEDREWEVDEAYRVSLSDFSVTCGDPRRGQAASCRKAVGKCSSRSRTAVLITACPRWVT